MRTICRGLWFHMMLCRLSCVYVESCDVTWLDTEQSTDWFVPRHLLYISTCRWWNQGLSYQSVHWQVLAWLLSDAIENIACHEKVCATCYEPILPMQLHLPWPGFLLRRRLLDLHHQLGHNAQLAGNCYLALLIRANHVQVPSHEVAYS